MGSYILSRLFQAVISVLAVSVIVFVLGRLAGNPVELLLEMGATQEARTNLIRELGLDRSYVEQFMRFISALATGNFGRSVINGAPVIELVREAFGNTIYLGLAAMLVAVAIALPIGVFSAAHRNSVFDRGFRVFAILGQSAPPFWVGIMLIIVFGVWLRWLPTSGMGGLSHVVLPAITLGWYLAAGVMRLTRTSMLEVLRADYVRLARAKGVPEATVIWKHAFKNAALPVLTFTALLFISLLSGTVVTETVFAWPGLGRLLVQSVTWRDYPVIEAVVLLLSVLYLGINLLVDILYAYLNPKIRFGSGN
jgi:peptide/nickel transport system permease protein